MAESKEDLPNSEPNPEPNICIICHDVQNEEEGKLYKMKCCSAHYHKKCFDNDIERMRDSGEYKCCQCSTKLTLSPPKLHHRENYKKFFIQNCKNIVTYYSMGFTLFSLVELCTHFSKNIFVNIAIYLLLLGIGINFKCLLLFLITKGTNRDLFKGQTYIVFALTIGNSIGYFVEDGYKTVEWSGNWIISPLILNGTYILAIVGFVLGSIVLTILFPIFEFIILHISQLYNSCKYRGIFCLCNFWLYNLNREFYSSFENWDDGNTKIVLDEEHKEEETKCVCDGSTESESDGMWQDYYQVCPV